MAIEIRTRNPLVNLQNRNDTVNLGAGVIPLEPEQYLKDAEVEDNKLVITKKDDTTVEFQGGGAVDSVNGKTGEVELTAEDVGAAAANHNHDGSYSDINHTHTVEDITDMPTIPTALSELTQDSTHRTVTDTEKQAWNAKQEPISGGNNIKVISNVVSAYSDNGDSINDSEVYARDISYTGTWQFIKNQDEIVVGFNKNSNLILTSTNGGLDFTPKQMETIIKAGCFCEGINKLKLVGVNKVYESTNGLNWTTLNSDSATWDGIAPINTFSGTVILIDSTLKRWKSCSDGSYTGNYSTMTDKPVCIVKSGGTSNTAIIFTDNGKLLYHSNNSLHNLPTMPTPSTNINKIVNVNNTLFALYKSSQTLNKYVSAGMAITSDDYWETYTLPLNCTAEDIVYNSLDGYYYIINNVSNYFKTKDFIEYTIVDSVSYEGKFGIRTKEGLIISPNNSSYLVYAPAREKLENRLQQLKMQLDKTRWAGEGLEVVGDKVKVKALTPLTTNINGISLMPEVLDDYYFTEEVRNAIRNSAAPVFDEPISPYEMDDWFWSYGYDYLINEYPFAVQVRFNEDGTFYNPMTYGNEFTVSKYERGVIYTDMWQQDFYYKKIGIEAPIE